MPACLRWGGKAPCWCWPGDAVLLRRERKEAVTRVGEVEKKQQQLEQDHSRLLSGDGPLADARQRFVTTISRSEVIA